MADVTITFSREDADWLLAGLDQYAKLAFHNGSQNWSRKIRSLHDDVALQMDKANDWKHECNNGTVNSAPFMNDMYEVWCCDYCWSEEVLETEGCPEGDTRKFEFDGD